VTKKIVQALELSELDGVPGKRRVVTAQPLDVVRDVKVRLTAVLGEASLSVGELFSLTDKSVVTLNTLAGEDVELMLDNQVVARGALVIADDNFGIRISEVMTKE